MPEAIGSMIKILKIENIIQSLALIFAIPFLAIISKTIIANLIEEYSEAKSNEIYSKY